MKIYQDINVYDSALIRIRRLFNEFKNVVVSVSGGKDSTVIFFLCLQVAKELNRLPLTVMFIDQEAEWEATIDIIKDIMYNPDVNPRWYQMPFQIFNATSYYEHWLYPWEEGAEWMRDKDPISIKENVYNEMRFGRLFKAISDVEYANEPVCYIAGMRCEEAPTRYMSLTSSLTYKDITWGKVLNKSKKHYTFYPIYDWSYSDVWKTIFDNHLPYNEIYNKYFMDGIPFSKMRVSNLHHEKSVHSLFIVQRYEPETYAKLVKRLKGVDMAGKFGEEQYFVHNLPDAFVDWKEYRDYLVEHLLDDEYREIFRKKFSDIDKEISYLKNRDDIYQAEINSILTNDWEFVKLAERLRPPEYACWMGFLKGKYKWENIKPEYRRNIRREDYGVLKTAD